MDLLEIGTVSLCGAVLFVYFGGPLSRNQKMTGRLLRVFVRIRQIFEFCLHCWIPVSQLSNS